MSKIVKTRVNTHTGDISLLIPKKIKTSHNIEDYYTVSILENGEIVYSPVGVKS